MNEGIDNILGEANSFIEVLEQASQIAPLTKPVLIIGERGTGKELIAHRLHYLSKRWQGPFISLNCAALSDTLLDSELFGHEAGAFTGAQKRHLGRFERADGGTLFLDELANAPMLVQEKLLRVIEYGQLERVGGTQPLTVDVRLVCATNENLPAMAREGKFRADLLDRLAFDVINLPPLRERRQDIMLLANNFAIQMCSELERPFFPGFTDESVEILMNYSWPGNIRELKNVVERSVYRHGENEAPLDNIIIDPFARNSSSDLPSLSPYLLNQQQLSTSDLPSFPIDLKQWLSEKEQAIITKALEQSQYNQRQAAKLLGVTYHQLRGMLRKNSENKPS